MSYFIKRVSSRLSISIPFSSSFLSIFFTLLERPDVVSKIMLQRSLLACCHLHFTVISSAAWSAVSNREDSRVVPWNTLKTVLQNERQVLTLLLFSLRVSLFLHTKNKLFIIARVSLEVTFPMWGMERDAENYELAARMRAFENRQPKYAYGRRNCCEKFTPRPLLKRRVHWNFEVDAMLLPQPSVVRLTKQTHVPRTN